MTNLERALMTALIFIAGATFSYHYGLYTGRTMPPAPAPYVALPMLLQTLAYRDADDCWRDAIMYGSFVEIPERPKWSTVSLESPSAN